MFGTHRFVTVTSLAHLQKGSSKCLQKSPVFEPSSNIIAAVHAVLQQCALCYSSASVSPDLAQ